MVLNIIKQCPLVLVANVTWRQSAALRSEDDKVVGNKTICVGRGTKVCFWAEFEIFRSLFGELRYNDISVMVEQLHLDAEFRR